MKYLITLVIVSTISALSLGQAGRQTDSALGIEVEVNQYNQAYYRHSIKKEETLYSLSKYFKVSVSDLLLVNDIRKGDNIPIGATIIIPINTAEIQTTPSREDPQWTPVIYTVKKKETLFKISSVYFPQKRENLMSRNNISSFALSRGRKLVVGWWGQAKAPSDLSEKIKDRIKKKLLARKNTENNNSNQTGPVSIEIMEESIEQDIDSILSEIVTNEESEMEPDSIANMEEPEINYKLGIASWDKSGSERENLFVMHNDAKPNSYIRLRYPVTGKEVTAQVICAIPKGVFADDINIIISPAVALALGALDSRFQIQMDYYK